MGFLEAVKHVYSNYVNFRDRAPRSEYWWFVLFNIIVSVIIGIVEAMLGLGSGMAQMGGGSMSASFAGGPLSIIWALVNILPGIGVASSSAPTMRISLAAISRPAALITTQPSRAR